MPGTWLESQAAGREITPNASSSGSRTRTLSQLKKSWTVAPAIARRNSSGRVMWPIETIVLVTVVPMLAPMMTGTAFASGSVPVATSVTTSAVVVDEDWTRLVTEDARDERQERAVGGARPGSPRGRTCPARAPLIPSPISSRATTNRNSTAKSASTRSHTGWRRAGRRRVVVEVLVVERRQAGWRRRLRVTLSRARRPCPRTVRCAPGRRGAPRRR